MRNLQQRSQKTMSFGLGEHTFARIDQYNCQFCRRCAGDHVARILNVAGRVGNNKFALRGGEIAVSYIYGDALLTFRTQTVSQQRQIHIGVTALTAGAFNRLELIFKDRLCIIE